MNRTHLDQQQEQQPCWGKRVHPPICAALLAYFSAVHDCQRFVSHGPGPQYEIFTHRVSSRIFLDRSSLLPPSCRSSRPAVHSPNPERPIPHQKTPEAPSGKKSASGPVRNDTVAVRRRETFPPTNQFSFLRPNPTCVRWRQLHG